MEKKYNIVFKGKLVLGYHIQDVRDALTAKFKLDATALGRLFSGDPQTLKRAVDLDTAQKFMQMMEKIGARCEMEAFDPDLKISSQPKENMNKTPEGMIICPKCGHKQKQAEVCSRCGLLIKKYKPKDTPKPEPEPEPEKEPPLTEDAEEPDLPPPPTPPTPRKKMSAAIGKSPTWMKWLFVGILWIALIVIIFSVAVPSFVEDRKKNASTPKGRESMVERPIQTEDAVLKPTFSAEFGEIRVGTAFITHFEENNQYLLVTAHGLFGSRGGLSKEYKWDDLSRIISKVKAISIGNPSKMVLTNTWLSVPDASPSKMYDSSQDIAAFYLISDFGMGSLTLSQALPNLDEKVWLLAEMPNRGKQFRFSATISQVNEKAVQYVFDDADLDPGSVIGAPVVNAELKVVAINTILISKDNKLIGIGNPAATARQKLLSAMQK